jgi:CelD/BcsL family acetyltransferase involved in cellulose biosynthesis
MDAAVRDPDAPSSPVYTVAVEEGLTPERIAPLWQAVEDAARPSFFLSWSWVGCWLRQSGLSARLLTVRRDGEVIGLALLPHRSGRALPFAPPVYHLTAAGDAEADSVCIEYNGVLARPDDRPAVVRALLSFVAAGPALLRLPGIDGGLLAELADERLAIRVEASRASPFVDLAALRQAGVSFLDSRSRNCRQQIRRSIRLYEDDGPLQLSAAESLDEAQAFLDRLAELHQRRWRARQQPGAFAQPFFRRFHQSLITDGWPAGQIDLLRLSAGDRPIGYLYNFLYGGRAWAYQSGFDYGSDARLKPGLVSHALAAQRYLSLGLDRYQLLAGASRYKASLANGSEYLYWLTLRPAGWSGACLDLVHRLWRRG